MLWIRTQDRARLLKVIEVSVDGKKILGVIGSGLLDTIVLGKYESKDRALEVLNDIFSKVEDEGSFSVTFTMPER